MNKFLVVLLVLVLFAFGWVIFSNKSVDQSQISQPQVIQPQPEVSSQQTQTSETVEETVEPQGSVDLVTLSEPASGATVTSPFIVKGTVVHVSGKATVRILNKDSKELISATANIIDGTFQLKMTYQFTNTKDGFLDVSVDGNQYPVEGSDSIRIPLKFE